MACTNGLSVKMDPNDVTAKKLEEERSSFVLPLKVRGVFGRPAAAGRGRGHYLASPKERKKENNFRRLNAPNFPFRSSASSSSSFSSSRSLAWLLHARRRIGPLSLLDRSAALLAWHMMHADGPDKIVLSPPPPLY